MPTPPTAIQADQLYLRNREDLGPYEDARFNSLLSALPDCYGPLTDYTLWGSLLRAIAQELARDEYCYSYDLVALNPQYLTPPDIKRRFAGPLSINKSFPNAAQTDQDYKAMLVALIPAYRQGTTRVAIERVIAAYTGENIPVVELYTLIGQGVYDDTYRNTLAVTVPATQADPFSAITAAAWLRTVSEDLYGAIDLAKPAHIGLDYSVSFGTSEDVQAKIRAITDLFLPEMDAVEPSPLEPVFTDSPLMLPTSPYTTLASWGQQVGVSFASRLTAAAWAALMSPAFQAEYQEAADGSYALNPAVANDVALVDRNGVLTGQISKARGILAPRQVTSWEIKGDSLQIYELD